MDENEQQRADELQSVVERVRGALEREADNFDLEDVKWDAESDCIAAYDRMSEHTVAISVAWL